MKTTPTQPIAESQDDRLITFREAAAKLPRDITRYVVWRWARIGLTGRNGETFMLKHVRMGHRLYTKRCWVDQFLQSIVDADLKHFRRHAQQPKQTRLADLPASHWEADRALTEAGM